MDRLNVQAHKNAINSTDEYVMDSVVTFDRVSISHTNNNSSTESNLSYL